MIDKKIASYKLLNQIVMTNGSCIYRAVACGKDNKQDELLYAIKEYTNSILSDALEHEKKISDKIENKAPKSIVIPILRVIEENGKQYAVMQFKRNGMFLSEMINHYGTGKIPLTMQLSIMEEILKSLSVLHSFDKQNGTRGYLHLDLHPGNIFLESADIEHGQVGNAKFIDFFNAASIADGEIVDKQNTITCMTLGYSSPELQAGEVEKFVPATDLFSVGAIFFKMLIGKELDKDINYEEIVTKYLESHSKNPVIPYAASIFLNCSLNYNPKYRYNSADNMLKAVMKLKQLHNTYQKKDYFSLFSCAYEMMVPKKSIRPDNIEYVEEKFKNAAEQLEQALKQDKIDVLRCQYIFEIFWQILNTKKQIIPNNTLLYNFLINPFVLDTDVSRL